MTRDSTHNYVHFTSLRGAEFFEEFNVNSKLPSEDIEVAPQHQPINPEDEDDVVPDQHAAFGITRATQARKETAWKDLGLEDLMKRAPVSSTITPATNENRAGSQSRLPR